MMDKLEKSSGQTVVTLNEAKLLLERQDDLNRPGQSSNNPYLAFRRRTEKMQTRKNR
ncbi:Enhancer of polycomb-like protein, partial [Operophtera brumata]